MIKNKKFASILPTFLILSCQSKLDYCVPFENGYPIKENSRKNFNLSKFFGFRDREFSNKVRDCVSRYPFLGHGKDIVLNRKYIINQDEEEYIFWFNDVTDIELVVVKNKYNRISHVYQKAMEIK